MRRALCFVAIATLSCGGSSGGTGGAGGSGGTGGHGGSGGTGGTGGADGGGGTGGTGGTGGMIDAGPDAAAANPHQLWLYDINNVESNLQLVDTGPPPAW